MLVQAKRQHKIRKTSMMSALLIPIEFINQNNRFHLCIWISNIFIQGRMPLTSLPDFSHVSCHLFTTSEFAGLIFNYFFFFLRYPWQQILKIISFFNPSYLTRSPSTTNQSVCAVWTLHIVGRQKTASKLNKKLLHTVHISCK